MNKIFLKNEQDTARTSFTGETTRSDQQKKLVELSTLIASIKDEIGKDWQRQWKSKNKTWMTWNSIHDQIVSFYKGAILITG